MTIYLSLLICVLGAILFGVLEGKITTLARDMFWVGLLVTLLSLAGVHWTFGR